MLPMAITLSGIEDYWNKHEHRSLFDDIDLPEGIDKDILVPYIITRAGDFPVIYIDPDYLYHMTTLWFSAFKPNFTKILRALTEEYNPLHNYDRTEDEFHLNNGARVASGSNTNSRTSSSSGTGSGSSTTENKVSAFNSSEYSNKDKTQITSSDSTTSSGTVSDRGSSSDNENTEDKGERHLRAFGNIGTTTSMTMLTEEVEGRQKYNIFEIISTMYIREFCVPIY